MKTKRLPQRHRGHRRRHTEKTRSVCLSLCFLCVLCASVVNVLMSRVHPRRGLHRLRVRLRRPDDHRGRRPGRPRRGACHLAEPWFLAQNSATPPAAEIDGQPVALEAALDRAAELLKAARSPLIYGLSRSTTEGQRAATALADRIGATIDTTASTGHAPSILALQQVGESTCTLGEVRNRADLVIYWGSDPAETHPRHRERYARRGRAGSSSWPTSARRSRRRLPTCSCRSSRAATGKRSGRCGCW